MLLDLPPEILQLVIIHLQPQDLEISSYVCKRLRQISSIPSTIKGHIALWHRIATVDIQSLSTNHQDYIQYNHLPRITQMLVYAKNGCLEDNTTLEQVVRKMVPSNASRRIMLATLYDERLWPFTDMEERLCFATSHYTPEAAVNLVMWLKRAAPHVTLEHYTFEAQFRKRHLWPKINGGEVHRSHVWIARAG